MKASLMQPVAAFAMKSSWGMALQIDVRSVVPAGPAGPCGPVGPIGPAGPARPCAPVAPTGPAGPAAPVAPAGPIRPMGPCGPTNPVGEPTHWPLELMTGVPEIAILPFTSSVAAGLFVPKPTFPFKAIYKFPGSLAPLKLPDLIFTGAGLLA